MMPLIKPDPIGNPGELNSNNIEYSPNITPDLSPAKRLKTLSSISPSQSSKGKSKIENEDEEEEEEEEEEDGDDDSERQLDSCGVCLLEEGMSIRGFIDSCEHYFCFVCIMEWAKIESRCPICKRRFSTIRRPPKEGTFLSERIVEVPVRDQVYYQSGNATIGPSDPYSQVKCSICSLGTDENLLLLCDLCDSAAHSYCAGLGATVPEGDWFCQDCTLSRDEHAKIESDANDGQTCSLSSNVVRTTSSHVSISDIVRESHHREPQTSPVVPSCTRNEQTGPCSNTQPIVGRTSNASNARTLQRCITVHARIRVLRENWNGFRGGSLRFSSKPGDGLVQGQSSSMNQESTSQKDPCSNASPNRGSYDVDKAWKMMDIAAKAMGKKHGMKSPVVKNSKHPARKERLLTEANKATPKPLTLDSKRFGDPIRHFNVGASGKVNDRCKFPVLEKDKLKHGTVRGTQNQVENCTTPSSRKVISSAQGNKCHGNGKSLPQKDTHGARPNVGSSNSSSCLVRSPLTSTQKGLAKAETATSFEEMRSMKNVLHLDRDSKKAEDAKSEIQSLVKLNLKLLTRDKKLEADAFKQIARHATHSILAACGIEPPKAGFRSFPRLVCNHVDETQKRPRSILMPTSCRECFYMFVKDVVNTIIFDRTGSSN